RPRPATPCLRRQRAQAGARRRSARRRRRPGAVLMTSADPAPLMAAVADELAAVRHGVEAVAGLVAELVASSSGEARDRALTEAQALDLASQRLDALSGLIRALGAGATPEQAVGALTLSDMAQRLGTPIDRPSSPAPDAASASGNLLLFD